MEEKESLFVRALVRGGGMVLEEDTSPGSPQSGGSWSAGRLSF